jgi:superkiller protein 3
LSIAAIIIAVSLSQSQGLAQQATARQAETLLKQGKTGEALPLLLRLHQSQPGNWRICHQLALAYTQLQQLEKAQEFYRKTLSINPGFLPARKNLAIVLWFLGRKQESELEFRPLVKALPGDPVPHLYLGLAEYERKHFSKAKGHFEKAGELAFDNPEVLPIVLETYLATKDASIPSGLMKQLERVKEAASTRPEMYLMLGEAYDRQGMPEKAYESYGKAIELDPQSEQNYLALASFASAHRNNEFALKILDQGLQRIPGGPKLLLQQGLVYALQGNLNQAEDSFLKASRADPKWSTPLLALGVSQLERGNLDEAASNFRSAAKVAPEDSRPQYLYATAVTRMGDSSRQEEVISSLEKAIALGPNDPEPRVSLGQAYAAADRIDDAVAQFEKALQIDPNNSAALYRLGLAYRRQGKKEAAQRLLQKFKEVRAKEKEEKSVAVQILKIVKDE